jgi:hypothetical protein
MQILIHVDSTKAIESLEELGLRKKGPYILRDFLNLLAKKVQANLRADLAASLNVKQPTFLNNAVKIDRGTFALTNRLHVTIHLTDNAEFIGQFEGGGEHVPAYGHNWLAVPNKAVFNGRIIRQSNPLRPANLQLAPQQGPFKHSQNRGQLIQGLQRTFIVSGNHGHGDPLILQRVSAKKAKKSGGLQTYLSGKTGTRLLYQLLKATQRPSKIHWYSVVDQTVQGEAEGIWTAVVKEALEHLRAKQA